MIIKVMNIRLFFKIVFKKFKVKKEVNVVYYSFFLFKRISFF